MGKKEQVKKRKKKILKWKYLLLFFFLLIVAGVYVILTQFHIEKVTIDGNTRYTDKEIRTMLERNAYFDNSLIICLMNRIRPIKGVPFIDKIDVTYISAKEIGVDVYEMAVAGCVEDMGRYIYFDKDGYILESSEERFTDVPCVEGLTFNKFVLHEKLPVKDKKKFEQILQVTQLIRENGLNIDRIRFSIADELILYKEDIIIQLGKNENLEDKMMNLPGILEEAKGMKGTLHMEEFTQGSKTVTFIPKKEKKVNKKQMKAEEDG